MPKLVITIEVDDLEAWEKGFRTHGDLFRRQTIQGGYDYTVIEAEKRVILCAEVQDVDTFFTLLESQDAEDAKDLDRVKRDTIRIHVLDRRFEF